MSEENEHTSEETEAEMNTENRNKEQSKSEDSDIDNAKQQSRVPLEEDNSQSPYRSDDQGGGSIYVLSSGEESNHPYNDEDEDEYADSEGKKMMCKFYLLMNI